MCNGTLPSAISVALNASDEENFAASRLMAHLKQACPSEDFFIGPPFPGVAQFAVGPGAATALGIRQGVLPHGGDTGLLDTTLLPSCGAVLTGGFGSARGTVNAVYRFLERMGFLFLAHDETVVPQTCSRLPPLAAEVVSPAFEYRANNQYQPAAFPEWGRAVGYNGNTATAEGASRGPWPYIHFVHLH